MVFSYEEAMDEIANTLKSNRKANQNKQDNQKGRVKNAQIKPSSSSGNNNSDRKLGTANSAKQTYNSQPKSKSTTEQQGKFGSETKNNKPTSYFEQFTPNMVTTYQHDANGNMTMKPPNADNAIKIGNFSRGSNSSRAEEKLGSYMGPILITTTMRNGYGVPKREITPSTNVNRNSFHNSVEDIFHKQVGSKKTLDMANDFMNFATLKTPQYNPNTKPMLTQRDYQDAWDAERAYTSLKKPSSRYSEIENLKLIDNEIKGIDSAMQNGLILQGSQDWQNAQKRIAHLIEQKKYSQYNLAEDIFRKQAGSKKTLDMANDFMNFTKTPQYKPNTKNMLTQKDYQDAWDAERRYAIFKKNLDQNDGNNGQERYIKRAKHINDMINYLQENLDNGLIVAGSSEWYSTVKWIEELRKSKDIRSDNEGFYTSELPASTEFRKCELGKIDKQIKQIKNDMQNNPEIRELDLYIKSDDWSYDENGRPLSTEKANIKYQKLKNELESICNPYTETIDKLKARRTQIDFGILQKKEEVIIRTAQQDPKFKEKSAEGEKKNSNLKTYIKTAEGLKIDEDQQGITVGLGGETHKIYLLLTKDERALYNYYIGIGDKKTADEYLNILKQRLYERRADEIISNINDINNPILRTTATTVASAGAGFDHNINGISRTVNRFLGDDMPTPNTTGEIYYEKMNNQLDSIPRTLSDIAYNAGYIAPNVLIPNKKISMASMAVSNAGNNYNDARMAGHSDSESLMYAGGDAFNSFLSQYFLGGIPQISRGGLSNNAWKSLSGKLVATQEKLKSYPALCRMFNSAIESGKITGNMADQWFSTIVDTNVDSMMRNDILGEKNEFKPFSEDKLYAAKINALTSGLFNVAPKLQSEGNVDGTKVTWDKNGYTNIDNFADEAYHKSSFDPSKLWSELQQGSFQENVDSVLKHYDVPKEYFERLYKTSAHDYTPEQKTTMKSIRDSIPIPNQQTKMVRFVPQQTLDNYLNGTYTGLRGFVAREQDVRQLDSYEKVYEGLGLDYGPSGFKPLEDDYMVMFEFNVENSDVVEVPYNKTMGGNYEYPLPFLGNGYTYNKTKRYTPEFYLKREVQFVEGMKIHFVYKNGYKRLYAEYSQGQGFVEAKYNEGN